jgi:integrase/recombinase XerD
MIRKSCVQIIKDFISHVLARGQSELTAKNYQYTLERFNEWLNANGGKLEDLTRIDVQQYLQHLRN